MSGVISFLPGWCHKQVVPHFVLCAILLHGIGVCAYCHYYWNGSLCCWCSLLRPHDSCPKQFILAWPDSPLWLHMSNGALVGDSTTRCFEMILMALQVLHTSLVHARFDRLGAEISSLSCQEFIHLMLFSQKELLLELLVASEMFIVGILDKNDLDLVLKSWNEILLVTSSIVWPARCLCYLTNHDIMALWTHTCPPPPRGSNPGPLD